MPVTLTTLHLPDNDVDTHLVCVGEMILTAGTEDYCRGALCILIRVVGRLDARVVPNQSFTGVK